MPKKKLDDYQQIDGKIHPETTEYEPTTLNMLWGDEGLDKYKTLNLEEYLEYVKDLNTAELRTHATKVGIIPPQNRDRLEKSLIREFNKHVAMYTRPKVLLREKKPSKDALRIMAEVK